MARSTIKETDILLLGKTGNGKSLTGNSILGRPEFKHSDKSESETSEIRAGFTHINEDRRILKVVDGPGLQETRLDKRKFIEKVVFDMSNAIWELSSGFHALVLVVKFGNRFTEEDLKVLTTLRKLFGDNFVKEFCIVIFTHGEIFDMNHEDSSLTFKDWCMLQKGPLRELIEECGWRIVLFNNKKPKDKVKTQVRELLSMIDKLSASGKRYTNELFEKVSAERDRFIVEMNAPELTQAFQSKIGVLSQKLSNVKMNLNVTVADLDDLIEEGTALMAYIKTEDKGTGVLNELRDAVQNIIQTVKKDRIAVVEKNRKEIQQMLFNDYKIFYEALKAAQNRRKEALFQNAYQSIFNMLNGPLTYSFNHF